jgi:hypothetical protein
LIAASDGAGRNNVGRFLAAWLTAVSQFDPIRPDDVCKPDDSFLIIKLSLTKYNPWLLVGQSGH